MYCYNVRRRRRKKKKKKKEEQTFIGAKRNDFISLCFSTDQEMGVVIKNSWVPQGRQDLRLDCIVYSGESNSMSDVGAWWFLGKS